MTLRDARIEDCETVARGICMALHREPDCEMRKITFPLFDELMYDDADHQETCGEPVESMDLDNMQDEAEAGEYYMDSLAVWPEWRGRGVGTKLMQAQIDKARELGFNKAALLVDPENENARRMYRKLGFMDDSEVYAFGQIFLKWVRKID